jgi:HEAT repeats
MIMKARKWMWIGLMSVGALPSWSWAQVPAGIAAGAGLAPAAAVGPTTAAAAQPQTLWSWLGISCPQLEACKQKKCATPCGQLLNKMTMPLTAFTGGVIPGYCPLMPSAAELADQGAVGAAAKIKAEEAQAKARKAAMRYLGTVDCSRFPDAQDALIMGLRGDTNECVRYEAALALGNGCCCTKATMESLSISASCADRDGKPREYSDRVRAASASALERCLSCYVDLNPPKVEKVIEGKPEEGPKNLKPEEIKVPGDQKNTSDDEIKDTVKESPKEKAPRPVGLEYYRKIESVPRHLIVEEARRVVEKYNQTTSAAVVLRRESSVIGLINQAMVDTNPTSPAALDSGMPVAKAEVVSARPQNLWEMVSRSADTTGGANTSKGDVVVKSTTEPPMMMAKSAPIAMPVPMPMPARMETMPEFPDPTVVMSEPVVVVKPLKPADTGGYGETGSAVVKPMKPAETGGYGEIGSMVTKPMKPAEMGGYGETGSAVVKPIKPAETGGYGEIGSMVTTPTKPAEMGGYGETGSAVVKSMKPAETGGYGEIGSMVTKPVKPAEMGGYGETGSIRPKTPAELASQPRSNNVNIVVSPAKNNVPNALPAEVTAKDTNKLTERESMKPVETAKPIVVKQDPIATKPAEPVVTKPAEPVAPTPTPTPLAQRVLTVMTEPNPAAVREQLAASLTKADFDSCPDITPVMVELARGTSPDSTRRAAIQTLVRNQVNSSAVIAALEKLADDAPPTVRVEAAIGLARLKVGK